MNMPYDVLAVQLFMFGMVSVLGCMLIEKLDRVTAPGYTKKSLSQSRNNIKRE